MRVINSKMVGRVLAEAALDIVLHARSAADRLPDIAGTIITQSEQLTSV